MTWYMSRRVKQAILMDKLGCAAYIFNREIDSDESFNENVTFVGSL